MKKLGYFLMAMGVIILIYAGVNQFMVYREQNALIDTIERISDKPSVVGDSDSKTEDAPQDESNVKNAIGILEIPSIRVKAAIVEGSDNETLKYAVGHVEGTGEIGKENQNFAIAGHRASTKGRFFYNLDKVKLKDLIYIQTPEKKYTYEVFKIETVSPDKVEVLEPQSGKSLVTLITCTPKYISSHRLIVYAELVNEQ